MRLRDDLLAAAGGVAPGRGVGGAARGLLGATRRGRKDRLVAGGGRFEPGQGPAGRQKTGPNPTDRAKCGSKHTLVVDAGGVPLAATLTGANRNDVTELLPAVDAIPPVRGRRGRPRRRPKELYADRAYDSKRHRAELRRRRVRPVIARRKTPHGSGLGTVRWVVERSISWFHQFRRLGTRYDRDHRRHEAFMSLGCSILCLRFC